jgi:hypothetical protein
VHAASAARAAERPTPRRPDRASRPIARTAARPPSARSSRRGAASWDFHWYRKDADRPWSHKRGSPDSQRDDAAGTAPICNPCNASRSYPGLNYKNVIGSWCV